MDNLTHTLLGVIAGEAVARCTRSHAGGLSDGTRRGLLIALGAAGGNLPDSDLLWSYGGAVQPKLGYLLHHRGHTHTVLGCLALALLLYAAALAWLRWRRHTPSRGDRLLLAAMAAFALFLHLGMDALNSYGVHPFWPVHNGWLYGDSVFIVEPLYWLAIAPLFFVIATRLARVALGTVLLLALTATMYIHRWEPVWLGAIALLTIALTAVGRRYTARTAALTSAAMAALVTCMFLAAGLAASRSIESIAAQSFPAYTTVDQVLTPIPTNPLCWDLLLVQTGGGRYVVRHGLLALGPARPANYCPQIFANRAGTAPLSAVPAPTSPDMHWLGEFSMPATRLASLADEDCAVRELLQFARAPFAIEDADSKTTGRWIVGDLRFDREVGLGLAEIEVADPPASGCHYHASWLPPRAALLARPH